MVKCSYSWTSSDLKDVERASMLVAADVIYRDDLTDAFFSTVERLMSVGSEKVLSCFKYTWLSQQIKDTMRETKISIPFFRYCT